MLILNKRWIVSAIALPACLLSSQSWADSDQLNQKILSLQVQTRQLQNEVKALKAHAEKRQSRVQARRKMRSNHRVNQGFGVHGMRVIASPYIGLRSAADGSDLLINSSTINQDLYLLKQKSRLIASMGPHFLSAPVIDLSGKIEGLLTQQGQRHQRSSSDLSLSSAELNINAMASPWATGFMSIDYDPPATANGNINTSHIYIRRAFVTIGNLDRSPIYGSVGQMYIPFGSYSSAMVTSSVTSDLAETDALTATLGYHKKGMTLVAYGFNGRPSFDSTHHELDAWGLNANYSMKLMNQTQKVGMGYVSNLAESITQRGNGSYNQSSTLTNVQGLNLNANLMLNSHVNIIAEYIRALNRFKQSDFSVNSLIDNAPMPTALDVELGYIFTSLAHPTNMYVAYNHTTDGANFGLARNSYVAVANTSLFKNTIQSLEYRHNHHYSAGDENILSAQLGVYF